MRNYLLILIVALCAGCHGVAVRKPVSLAPPIASAHSTPDAEAKLAEARKFIGALIEQNDVLREQLRVALESHPQLAAETAAPAPVVAAPAPIAGVAPQAQEKSPDLPLATPNAEGLIDLASLAHPADVPVNPFTLRASASDPKRELSLLVQGLSSGPNASALINDRVYQVGDSIESLKLERIDPDTVTLRTDAHRIKLTAAEKPTRVRLP